jgi:hypothetical protein
MDHCPVAVLVRMDMRVLVGMSVLMRMAVRSIMQVAMVREGHCSLHCRDTLTILQPRSRIWIPRSYAKTACWFKATPAVWRHFVSWHR